MVDVEVGAPTGVRDHLSAPTSECRLRERVHMQTWTVGDATIDRVEDPGFELLLPQDDATVETLQSSPWLAPHPPPFVRSEWLTPRRQGMRITASGSCS